MWENLTLDQKWKPQFRSWFCHFGHVTWPLCALVFLWTSYSLSFCPIPRPMATDTLSLYHRDSLDVRLLVVQSKGNWKVEGSIRVLIPPTHHQPLSSSLSLSSPATLSSTPWGLATYLHDCRWLLRAASPRIIALHQALVTLFPCLPFQPVSGNSFRLQLVCSVPQDSWLIPLNLLTHLPISFLFNFSSEFHLCAPPLSCWSLD